MIDRTNSKVVTFNHPFLLKGIDRIVPPGAYRVLTDEELIECLSFPVYRRLFRGGIWSKTRLAGVRAHDATTSKISDAQLFYGRQHGLSVEEAMIVNGFVKDVPQHLPMEFAVEAQISISLEGSVG
jgi:hypothetical protein